jgi:undecaprenyl-diphosphatase
VTDAEGALLGLVQGLTEFLPVSSDGHLVIAQRLLGIAERGMVFEIVVHVATLAATLLFYRARVGALVRGALAREPDALRYGAKLAVATLPAVVAALAFGDLLEAQFESARVAALGLLFTGAVLWTTRRTFASARLAEPGWSTALWMGCAQALAILPGVSRSGLTLAAALALGVAPLAAAEFSFLMGVAAITGAAVWALPELLASPVSATPALSFGALTALVSGVAAIWFCIRLLSRGSLHWFAYYTWAAGLAMLLWLHAQAGA